MVDIVVSGDEPPVMLTVSGGIGPAAVYSGTSTTLIGVSPIAAGKNISITTTGGSFTIIGADAPVSTVQGRTGNVVLSLVDLTASPLVHTHTTTQITGLTAAIQSFANVVSVQGRTGSVVLTLSDLTASPLVHTHSTSDITGLTAAIQSFANVVSVQGRTGSVVLTLADLTAQAAGTYATLVGGLVPAGQLPSFVDDCLEFVTLSVFPSVGETGKIYVDTTTKKIYRWSGSAYIEISPSPGSADAVPEGTTNLYFTTIRAAAAAPVQSVAGMTGTVVLATVATSGSAGDLIAGTIPVSRLASSGTPSSTTFLRGDGSWSVEAVTSVNGMTGTPSVVGGSGITVTTAGSSITVSAGSSLPAQSGSGGNTLSTDGTAASWVSRFSVVDPVVSAGAGVTFTRDTTAGTITVNASGASLSGTTPLPLGVATAGSATASSRGDHVHLMPSASDVGAALSSHAHPYVTSLGGKTGALSIIAGANVTVTTGTASISIAAASSTGLAVDAAIDEGEYVGVSFAGIVITAQPQNTAVVAAAASFGSWSTVTSVANLGSYRLNGLVFADGRFGMLGDDATGNISTGLRFLSSTDGTTWTSTTMASGTNSAGNRYGGGDSTRLSNSLSYANGVWLAVANSFEPNSINGAWAPDQIRSKIMASSNSGSTWSTVRDGGPELITSLIWGDTRAVAITRYGINSSVWNTAISSADGANWTPRLLPQARYWTDLAYGGGTYVAVSYAANASEQAIATSTDGISWTAHTAPATQSNWTSVVYGNGAFVAVAPYFNAGMPSRAMRSTNGTTWAVVTMPAGANWQQVTFAGGFFMAFGEGTDLAISADGVNWVLRDTNRVATWNSAAYGASKLVVVAGDAAAAYGTATIGAGGSASASFTVASTSTAATPTYQWQVSSDGGTTYVDISGATSATLALTVSSADTGKKYRAMISSVGTSSRASSPATLTVT